MMRKMTLLALAACGALLALGAAAKPRTATPARDYKTAQQATALAAAAGALLLNGEEAPAELLHAEGCVIWSQPGVALVAGKVYTGGAPVGDVLPYDRERARGLLYALPGARWGEPPAPREEDYAGGYPPPQAWLLERAQARARLGRYNKGYSTWRSGAGDPLLGPAPKGSLAVDFAIVYIGQGGPLELYFQREQGGRLRLRHVVYYDYFSA
jgi:hypothetical protein